MTTYKHIVQVHPVENGEVNLSKVWEIDGGTKMEMSFLSKEEATNWEFWFNTFGRNSDLIKAVYLGRVNDATGELE
jgi:hypothetical protein